MCGISGIIDFKNLSSNKVDLIESMNFALKHRGPDDSGKWENTQKTVAFGHQRLSIIDLTKSGHQPMIDDETGNVLIFNGEIFNYKELNSKYLKDEHFYSNSDSETILKLFKKFGLNFLKLLNGMFSIALWDNTANEIILARDFSGKKPLYFTLKGNCFSFASEIKALFTLPWVDKTIDNQSCYDFLTYNAVHTPKTMFNGIEKFKPGHFMKLGKNGVENYQSFRVLQKKEINFSNEDDLADQVFQKFDSSIKRRMLSDVPLGVFLSGGVDSSAVLALMSMHTSSTITSFSIGFEDQEKYTETLFAEKIAKKYNSNHLIKTVKKEDLLQFLPTIIDIYDEPQADTTAIPIYFLAELAKENGIKVVLNGDGADELFAGYNAYYNYSKYFNIYTLLKSTPYFLKKGLKSSINSFNNNNVLNEILERLVLDQEFFWPGASGFKESQKKKFLKKKFIDSIGNYSSYSYVEKLKNEYKIYASNKSDNIDWMCFAGYKQAVIERFLFRSDKLGMANSIEIRSPFLEHDFIEFSLSIPSKYKIKNKIPKYILKKAFERELSNDILYRKKMGFCLPLKEWAGETIIEDLNSNLKLFCKETPFFEYEELNKEIKQFKNGNLEGLNRLWTIYFFMNWYKKWF